MLELEYRVENAGWALASIRYEERTVEMTVSYLHDTLRDLAESTLHIIKGGYAARIVFIDEPGEHQIRIKRVNDEELEFSVLWFDDWESWGMYPSDKYQIMLEGICTVSRLKHQVTKILCNIYEKIGEEKYLELWGEHEFPTDLYKELDAA